MNQSNYLLWHTNIQTYKHTYIVASWVSRSCWSRDWKWNSGTFYHNLINSKIQSRILLLILSTIDLLLGISLLRLTLIGLISSFENLGEGRKFDNSLLLPSKSTLTNFVSLVKYNWISDIIDKIKNKFRRKYILFGGGIDNDDKE